MRLYPGRGTVSHPFFRSQSPAPFGRDRGLAHLSTFNHERGDAASRNGALGRFKFCVIP